MTGLRRPKQPMPADVAAALAERDLRPEYDQRPPYQRNDYLGWIGEATQAATRRRRIEQMLDELDAGGVYMGMDHPPSAR